MKKVTSKLDKKEYYLATAVDTKESMWKENELYQVRKATAEDCENYENYCIVNGTFFDELLPELTFFRVTGKQMANRYQGTYYLHKQVLKSECKKYLKYVN